MRIYEDEEYEGLDDMEANSKQTSVLVWEYTMIFWLPWTKF